MKNKIDRSLIKEICSGHNIKAKKIDSVSGSFNREVFFINDTYILRSSDSEMTDEIQRLKRVESLSWVPKIKHEGVVNIKNEKKYYILLDMLPGDDFVNGYPKISTNQQKTLGKNTAAFLDNVHSLYGTSYDIGLYIPVLPGYTGSWRSGHMKYCELLQQGKESLPIDKKSKDLLAASITFLQSMAGSLTFQRGPRLLHNDLHPKNIIINNGMFSGVIDWECSQFGESDFELTHVIHWTLYPPEQKMDFRPFLGSLFQFYQKNRPVPEIEKRLTIYQIEHEIQQIIWSNGGAADMRIPRIKKWMDGAVEKILQETG